MNKRILLLVLVMICLLVGCKNEDSLLPSVEYENLLLPAAEDENITFKTLALIYTNKKSTTHSLGDLDSSFTFSKDKLIVWNATNKETYDLTYEEVSLTNEEFKDQFDIDYEIYDISSYKNILQYNLCSSTKDSPGYKLFILDDEYWIGTLYKNSIWRIVSIEINK